MADQSTPARLRSAVRNQAPELAAAAAERFQSASIPERLDRLATAIREERYDDAEVQLRRLVEQYEADREGTRRRVATARAAQVVDSVSLDQQQSLAEYTRSVTATQAKRAQLLAQAGELVVNRGASDQSPTVVADTADATKSQERTRQDRRANAQSITDSVSLPPTLEIATFVIDPERAVVGEVVRITVGLVNVGDNPATEVKATVTTPSGPAELTYVELQPGASSDRQLDVTPAETGTQTVAVEATATETNTVSRNETLLVTSSPGVFPGQDTPATDPDNDGIYEDLNGNNRFDFADVVTLFNELNEIDPTDTEFVDVNDDGTVSFSDVVALFSELQQ